jgi:hypothetical protein
MAILGPTAKFSGYTVLGKPIYAQESMRI